MLERAKAGDRSAVRVLIERALPPLQRWTHGRIPPYGRGSIDTEDVVQDAVMRTIGHLQRIQLPSVDALQGYLRRTVINGIRDVVRQVRRRGVPQELPDELHDGGISPLEAAIRRERTTRFVEALQRLRPVERQVVIWRIELGYSHDEIARRLGKPSAAAARMTVTRAIKRLATEMGIPAGPAATG